MKLASVALLWRPTITSLETSCMGHAAVAGSSKHWELGR